MDDNDLASDWSASHDGTHSVFVNEESNSMLMSVFTITEKEFVANWGNRFSKVYLPYFTESKDVPSASLHIVC